MAAANENCVWRRMSLETLEKAGKDYRIAYSSSSSLAVSAAVLAGLAIAALPEIVMKPGMRILSEDEGFPSPGEFQIGLLHKPGELSPAATALLHQIRESLNTIGEPAMAAE